MSGHLSIGVYVTSEKPSDQRARIACDLLRLPVLSLMVTHNVDLVESAFCHDHSHPCYRLDHRLLDHLDGAAAALIAETKSAPGNS